MLDKTVYVIGLDGVPPEMTETGIEDGRLPNLERMQRDGVSGTTESTVPPLSMIAWSTFATGRNPGNHGIYNFMLKEKNGYASEFVSYDTLRENATPVWEYLDALGHPSGVMNVMPGYPPSRTSGFHIADNVTTPPDGNFVFPERLEDEIQDEIGEYYIDPYEKHDADASADELADVIDTLLEIEADRLQLAEFLLKEYDCAFYSLVFSGPDNILHSLGHILNENHPKHDPEIAARYDDVPMELLQMYDEFIGAVIDDMSDKDALFVLSDHGHGPVYQTINLNSWLYNNGFLSLRSTPWTRFKQFGYNHLYDWVESALYRLHLFSRIKMRVAQTSGGDGSDLSELLTISRRDIDWNETVAFTIASGGQVYINTDKHENGLVTDAEYESVRNELRQELLDIRHPERDEPVIDAVYDGEEVYGDGFKETRPDLVCLPAPGYQIQFPQNMKTNKIFSDPPRTGSHTSANELHGVFFAYGGQFDQQSGVTVPLTDFAPTTMDLLNLPVPAEMDGDVRNDIYDTEGETTFRRLDDRVKVKTATRSVAERLHST